MKHLVLMLALSLLLPAFPAGAVESFRTPTGVIAWEKQDAFDGYTIISPGTQTDTYLIDMEGRVVHTWKTGGRPGMYAEMLPNGNLLRGLRVPEKIVPFGGVSGVIQELDWDGKVVWEKTLNSKAGVTHHAYERLPNGNTMIVCWGYKTYEEAVKKGRKPGTIPKPGEGMAEGVAYDGFWEDFIVEVDSSGKTVWEWHTWDHIGTGKDKLDINYILPVKDYYGDSDWFHINTVRYIPETNQILSVSRNFGEVYLIDKASGKIVYRWGNPSAYGQGKRPGFADNGDQQIFGPHDATWLGDGKVLLFDNGWQRPESNRSRVLILDTKTDKIVWEYQAMNLNSFFTAYQGSVQMLPNKNILITSTQTGHIFEVTQTKRPQIVWEYVNPWTHKGPTPMLTEAHALDAPGDINIMGNFVHRAFRVPKDHPGLKGKKLSPKVLFPDAPKWWEVYNKAEGYKPAF